MQAYIARSLLIIVCHVWRIKRVAAAAAAAIVAAARAAAGAAARAAAQARAGDGAGAGKTKLRMEEFCMCEVKAVCCAAGYDPIAHSFFPVEVLQVQPTLPLLHRRRPRSRLLARLTVHGEGSLADSLE